jgi:hypothetical protein
MLNRAHGIVQVIDTPEIPDTIHVWWHTQPVPMAWAFRHPDPTTRRWMAAKHIRMHRHRDHSRDAEQLRRESLAADQKVIDANRRRWDELVNQGGDHAATDA